MKLGAQVARIASEQTRAAHLSFATIEIQVTSAGQRVFTTND